MTAPNEGHRMPHRIRTRLLAHSRRVWLCACAAAAVGLGLGGAVAHAQFVRGVSGVDNTFTSAAVFPGVNLLPPRISGTTQQGTQLSVVDDTWTNSPTLTYQWQDCDSSGMSCVDVATGGTSSTYTPTANDVGSALEVVVTATDAGGTSPSVSSGPTSVVLVEAPLNNTLPTISGTAQQGTQLSASTGSWSDSPTSYAYQWQDCNGSGLSCDNVASGGTSSTYTPGGSEVGDTIEVVVTATNAGGDSAPVASTATAAVLVEAPVNAVSPSIPGTPQEGVQMTGSIGTWNYSPTSYSYRWALCDSSGINCSTIVGATSQTYTPASGDVGHTLRFIVSATNAGGSDPAVSSPSAVVLVEAPVNNSLPSISGTAQQGTQLSASTGSWSDSPTSYAYQWQDCNSSGLSCSNVASGGTSSTYTPAGSEIGDTLEVTVTATNAGGTSIPWSSAPTALVLVEAPVNNTLPSISGTAQQGVQLTAAHGSWSDSPNSYAYQWQYCTSSGLDCANVPSGGTSSTYTPTSGDVGHTLEVAVTATNAGGDSSPSSSAPTAVVLVEAPLNNSLPSISGTPQQGVVLTAAPGSWSDSPTSYAYQWQDCNSSGLSCSNVASGGTSSTYTPGSSEIGDTLEVIVTATNLGGTSSPATSTATAAVLVEAPLNNSVPSISGTAQQGVVLTAAPGSWSDSPTSYAYQWQDCNSSGLSCSNVASGGTSSTYTPGSSEIGDTLEVIVTATNLGGTSSPASSAATTVVAGAIAEFSSALSGNPIRNAPGPDGSMWFTETSPSRIAEISASGTITEYSTGLNTGSSPSGIVEGSDGNMYFGDVGTTKAIGEIKVANHAITEYTTSGYPAIVTAGPDGNIWFANDVAGGGIGQLTITGHGITLYKTSAGALSTITAWMITPGPAGSNTLWFTDRGTTPAVGEVNLNNLATNPTHVITEYSTGLSAALPYAIVTGPDNNIWFTDSNGPIWEMNASTQALITDYTLSGMTPRGLTVGSDGNLWFTDGGHHAIGRITTAGAITEYNSGLNSGPSPLGIAAGSDGNLWFTDQGTTKAMGRLALSGLVDTNVPTISGTATHGNTLTAGPGTWSGSPTPAYMYQWQDCNINGANCVDISGATANTYGVATTDEGKTIRVVLTATNSPGYAPAPSAITATVN